MPTDYDPTLESLVRLLTPRWTEMRVKEASSWRPEATLPFIVSEVLLVGEPSLLCFVSVRTCAEVGGYDYFPIGLRVLEAESRELEEYVPFARAGGTSDLDLRLQWLFDYPSFHLIEATDDFYEEAEGNVNRQILHYYGSLELADSSGKKALQINVTGEVDFTIELRIIDGTHVHSL